MKNSAEIPASAPRETWEQIRDQAVNQALAKVESHKKTTLEMALRSVNPDKFTAKNERKLNHAQETLLKQIRDNDKETITKVPSLKLTLRSALENLNQDLIAMAAKIIATDPRAFPTEGRKNFTDQINALFADENHGRFTAQTAALCEEMLNYQEKLLHQARAIDLSL